MSGADSPRIMGANPVIPVKDMTESLAFYDRLGFATVFDDRDRGDGHITYAGVARDGLCLHLQQMVPGQDDAMPLIRIRVEHIEPLYHEYRAVGVVAPTGALETKPWGSRDFGLYDPNGAALVFYEDI